MSNNCKALLIGINYFGTNSQLNGCINDVKNVLAYLKERFPVVNEIRLAEEVSVPTPTTTKEVLGTGSDDDFAAFQDSLEKGTFIQTLQAQLLAQANASGKPNTLGLPGLPPKPNTPSLPGLPAKPNSVSPAKPNTPAKPNKPNTPAAAVTVNPMSTYVKLNNVDMSKSTLDVLILTDDQTGKHLPTKQNMLNAFKWLVSGATSKSNIFLQYSGHGSNEVDRNADEVDGRDESLVPLDYLTAGCIVDDEIRKVLIDPLPKGCELRVIIDACHSGTGLDVKYCYRDVNFAQNKQNSQTANPKQKDTECNVVCWSGCRDDQTSADAYIKGSYAGALTATFMDIMRDKKQDKSFTAIYTKLLEQMQKGKYTQKPQLSSGKPIDLNSKFDLF